MQGPYEDNPIWQRYYRRACFVANLLKFVPFVKMIGLNGSMVRGIFSKKSDIDFLIITEKDRIFTTRLIVSLLVWLMGIKKNDQNSAGRICLNRFATVNQLEIKPHNQYHAWTFSKLIPLFAENNIYDEFINSNQWMVNYGYPISNNKIAIKKTELSSIMKKSIEFILNGRLAEKTEKFLEKKQRQRINKRLQTSQRDWNVKVTKDELCFHLRLD